MRAHLTSIRIQLIAVALLVSVGVAALFMPFASTQLERGFDEFEVTYVAQERERLELALHVQTTRLGQTAIDYSHWNDTVEYVAGTRPDWPDENLTAEVFVNFGAAFIVVADRNLEIITARTPTADLPAAQAAELVRGGDLCAVAMRERTYVSRFAWIGDVPQIVTCAPIMPTEPETADVVGAMVWVVLLDEVKIAEVRSLTRFPFELDKAGDAGPDQYRADGIVSRLPLRNSDESVSMMAVLHLPRPLGAQRDVATRTMLLLLLGAVCIPSLLMLVFLEVFVARRIRRVSHWVRSMRGGEASNTPRSPPEESGFAELRMLTKDFAETHDKVRQLNRLYVVLSSINGLIVRATDRDELFQETCRILVETGRFAKAWIGLVDEERPPIRILAWAGAEDRFFADLQARLVASAANPSSVLSRTLRGATAIVCNDIANDPTVVEQKRLLESGSRSFTLLPLIVDERTVGVISIHSSVPGFFDKEETDLLLGLASDVAFALDNLMKKDRISYLAHHDTLTGLPNRVRFAELLTHQLGDAPRSDHFLCVALLDLVRFRRINETLGRRAGDALLIQVGERLRSLDAFAARIGTDVFALRIVERRSAGELARDFEHVAKHCFDEPFLVGDEEIRMGCRIGAAVAPGDGEDAESLLRNAESALRKARSSTAPFVFYGAGMNTTASEAVAQESKLRRAIERGEFVLHYQPKVRLPDRRICGVEALIRWQDPERGLVPPLQFIPVLEETGLIAIVGKWALRRALDDAAQWKARSGTAVRVAVNVSALQLNQPNFAQNVAELIGDDGGHNLELEITESVIMDDVDRKILMLDELRALGISIAIDDFGTGYSSLAYISRLPITSLKIDRIFINGLTEPQGFSVVSSIIALARPLNLKVVAEGVETEEQARLVELLRCDEAQGYLFGKPVPSEQLIAMLLAETAAGAANPP